MYKLQYESITKAYGCPVFITYMHLLNPCFRHTDLLKRSGM